MGCHSGKGCEIVLSICPFLEKEGASVMAVGAQGTFLSSVYEEMNDIGLGKLPSSSLGGKHATVCDSLLCIEVENAIENSVLRDSRAQSASDINCLYQETDCFSPEV
ncbi:unnamed protein product [Ilex paraguariensis]|uniref:Uncharacterized protein n=1 Tax=Ilex paraguariensis TaxID=185542 RepID=A0ABC8S0Q5_9AQUA